MRELLILLTAAVIPSFATAQYQPLNVKTGQWQTVVNVNSAGTLAIPSDQMAKLAPEQRARVEAAMKQASKPKMVTRTNQDCLTQDELDRGTPFKEDEKQCTQKVLSSTSRTLTVEQDCMEHSAAMKTTISFKALTPELVRGTGTVTVTSEGHTYTSSMELTSKWISASCDSKVREGVLAPGLKGKLSAPAKLPAGSPAPR